MGIRWPNIPLRAIVTCPPASQYNQHNTHAEAYAYFLSVRSIEKFDRECEPEINHNSGCNYQKGTLTMGH